MSTLSDHHRNCLDERSRGLASMLKVIQYRNEQFVTIHISDFLFVNQIIMMSKAVDCLLAVPLVVISTTVISSDGDYAK
jgi:hypothetical protein